MFVCLSAFYRPHDICPLCGAASESESRSHRGRPRASRQACTARARARMPYNFGRSRPWSASIYIYEPTMPNPVRLLSPTSIGQQKSRHENSLLLFPHSLPMSRGAQAAIKPRHHGRQSWLCPAPISFMP